jgi:hypothetical protein
MRGISAMRHRQTDRSLPWTYGRTQRNTNRNRHIPAFSHRPEANQVSSQRHANLRIPTRSLLKSSPVIVAANSDYCRSSGPAHLVAPPEQLPTSRRREHPPLANHHPPREDNGGIGGDTTTDQAGDRTAVQELSAKRLLTMPTRHCDRLRWTIPVASYSALRDSVPPATRIRNAARGGLPRAALCLAGLDTANRFPYALSASICRRRAHTDLTPDHSCRGTKYILKPNQFTPSPCA